MFLVLDLLIREFQYKLHARNGSDGINMLLKLHGAHNIVLHQPEEVEVLEFG